MVHKTQQIFNTKSRRLFFQRLRGALTSTLCCSGWKKVISFIRYMKSQGVTLYNQTQLTKQGTESHSQPRWDKTKQEKPHNLPLPPPPKNRFPRHKPRVDMRPQTPSLICYSEKTTGLPWRAEASPPCWLCRSRGCGETQSSTHDWAQQPLLLPFLRRWIMGAEWSPLALIPHTCGAGGALRAALPAPHRCREVPGVSHARGRALMSRPRPTGNTKPCWCFQSGATTFHQRGRGWGKAGLPVPSRLHGQQPCCEGLGRLPAPANALVCLTQEQNSTSPSFPGKIRQHAVFQCYLCVAVCADLGNTNLKRNH